MLVVGSFSGQLIQIDSLWKVAKAKTHKGISLKKKKGKRL